MVSATHPDDLELQSHILSLPLELQTHILDALVYSSFQNLKLGVSLNYHYHQRYRKTLFRHLVIEGEGPFDRPALIALLRLTESKKLSPFMEAHRRARVKPKQQSTSTSDHDWYRHQLPPNMTTISQVKSIERLLKIYQSVESLTLHKSSDIISLVQSLELLPADLAKDLFINVRYITLRTDCTNFISNYAEYRSGLFNCSSYPIDKLLARLMLYMKPQHVCLYFSPVSSTIMPYNLALRYFVTEMHVQSFTVHGIRDILWIDSNVPLTRYFLSNVPTTYRNRRQPNFLPSKKPLSFSWLKEDHQNILDTKPELHVLNWQGGNRPIKPEGYPPHGENSVIVYRDEEGDACICCGER